MKKLRITISPSGEVSVGVEGVAGGGCLDATKFLEDALGGKVEAREMTSEYYSAEQTETVTVGE